MERLPIFNNVCSFCLVEGSEPRKRRKFSEKKRHFMGFIIVLGMDNFLRLPLNLPLCPRRIVQ